MTRQTAHADQTTGVASAPDPIARAMDVPTSEALQLLKPSHVAAMLGVSERTLERWRMTGDGPAYLSLTRNTVRYRSDELARFLRERVRSNTAS